MPGLADASDLQEEDAVVVEHVVDLLEEFAEKADADVLGHLEAGDFFVAALWEWDVAVVHAENLALAFFNTCLAQGVVSPCCLIYPQCNTRDVRAIM